MAPAIVLGPDEDVCGKAAFDVTAATRNPADTIAAIISHVFISRFL
jgi:hypothetical protein